MWLDIMVPNWGGMLAGLMLGFSIYVAMNIATMASAKAFGAGLFAQVLWFMSPLCLRAMSNGLDRIPLGVLARYREVAGFRRSREEIPKLWLLNSLVSIAN